MLRQNASRLTGRGGPPASCARRGRSAAPELFAGVPAPRSTRRDPSCTATSNVCDDGGRRTASPSAVKGRDSGRRGIPTTAGSKILEGYVPVYERDRRLSRAFQGARAAHPRQDEHRRVSRWARRRENFRRNGADEEPVGSRARAGAARGGGSAAAVSARPSAGPGPLRLGHRRLDQAAVPRCVREPSGLRPTYGTVSRYGAIAFASSLDQIRPGREDSARLARSSTRSISGP